jgi:hypothetical protein
LLFSIPPSGAAVRMVSPAHTIWQIPVEGGAPEKIAQVGFLVGRG